MKINVSEKLYLKVTIGKSIKLLSMIVPIAIALSACSSSTTEELDEYCIIPDGVEVVSITLDEAQEGEITETNGRGYRVTVELNREIEDDEACIICLAVRDRELVKGNPLAVGWIGVNTVTDDDGISARDNVFILFCDNGNVAGRAILDQIGGYDLTQFNGNSGERSTGIFVQHIESFRTLSGNIVGIQGRTSNRIRVSCPQ